MFQSLSAKLGDVFRSFTGQSTVTQPVIDAGVKTIRRALLEADVAAPVITQLTENFSRKALGQAITPGAKPGDMLTKLFHDELVDILGKGQTFSLKLSSPSTIMLVGLQGAGKTTFAARLAKHLQNSHNRKVMLVSADVYRPAAIDQLAVLANQAGATFFSSSPDEKPLDIVTRAQAALAKHNCDTLIIDTAGRNHVDAAMMQECETLAHATKPEEILFVLDSMTGQDAANIAQSFNAQLALTGSVLTKTDSDTRGGAALSVQQITQKPIKFLTSGEKLDDLDTFEPDRIAAQILGMGDIIGLIKKLESTHDPSKTKKLADKFKKNLAFDFDDLRDQLKQMLAMGGLESIMGQLPFFSSIPKGQLDHISAQSAPKNMIALIDSMTQEERLKPFLVINVASRRKRICRGSGRPENDLKQLIKQYQRMQKMMQNMRGKKMHNMMNQMQDLFGGKS
jgi:signal recognition particle subunit SRP54